MHKSSNNELLELTTSDMRAFQVQNLTPVNVPETQHVIQEPNLEKQISAAIEKLSQDIVHEKLKKTISEIIMDLHNLIEKLSNI